MSRDRIPESVMASPTTRIEITHGLSPGLDKQTLTQLRACSLPRLRQNFLEDNWTSS